MAIARPKQDALDARLAGLILPADGLQAARESAVVRLQAMGMPGRRDEYWRYTDPADFNSVASPCTTPSSKGGEAEPFARIDRLRIVFVDGVFDRAASDDLALSGVQITRLADKGVPAWAHHLYGALETEGQHPVPRPLAALNTAYASDGVLIRVTGRAPKPIALVYIRNSSNSDAYFHHCIQVDADAELTLLESGAGAARSNTVMEVDLAAGARLHHIRTQGRDADCRTVTHLFARLADRAQFKSFTMTANGILTRNEAVIDLGGNDSVAHLAGAALGDGQFHHDDTVFVTHKGQRCESRQVFKKVLKNGAVGVFQGKILVKSGAQKTDGYQISQSLLLDENSQFLAKPELEIYADDVKCSHGSTSGAIDETALFYLRSRGVALQAAQALLVLAFLAEAISEIADEAIAEDIHSSLESWLAQHGA